MREGKSVAASLPGALYIQGDCSTREGCEALIKEVAERCGQLDLLVCHLAASSLVSSQSHDLFYKISSLLITPYLNLTTPVDLLFTQCQISGQATNLCH